MSQRRRPGRPATGQTPTRSVRVGDVWDRAREIAAQRGETMTAVITRALEAYILEAYIAGEEIRPATADEHAR